VDSCGTVMVNRVMPSAAVERVGIGEKWSCAAGGNHGGGQPGIIVVEIPEIALLAYMHLGGCDIATGNYTQEPGLFKKPGEFVRK